MGTAAVAGGLLVGNAEGSHSERLAGTVLDLRAPGFLQSPITFSLPSREKGTETFRASVVLPSKDKAAFLLSYEELLQRRLGKYEHVVSVRPQQLVGRLTVEVTVLERSGIAELEVLGLQNSRQRGSGRGPGERCWRVRSGIPALKQIVPLPSRPKVKQGSEGQQPSRDSALCIFKDNLFLWLHRVLITVQGIFCSGTQTL